MKHVIVPMAEAHAAQVAALEKLCFTTPWSEASVRSELTNPLSVWLCAVRGGEVIGYIGSQAVLDEADVMNVAVAPGERRKGVARELVRALCERLADRGVESLTLEVRPSNEAALRLYDQEGFRRVGRRRRYYVDPVEDALILRKEWEI